ncbi:MAG TPA: nitrous oxide reductase family maturation protein NosD [Gemmatimonadales bacterium]|nr:nitrous oxide reductase family maturation protein NosD [Gemmatimonadales bacterium]
MPVVPLLLALAQAVGPAPARMVQVRGGAESSLSAALLNAAPGDTVRVGAGRHAGTFVIDRAIVLLGEPGAILDGERKGTVVTVRADSVVVAGFTIKGSGRSLDRDEAAIRLDRCTGCRVSDNRITDPLHGIYLLESRGVTLARNEITGAADLPESLRGNGIHLFSSRDNRIEGNRIRRTRDGIYFSFAGENHVLDNDVAEVRYGLHYMYSDGNAFDRNSFARNAAGAAIMFSKRIAFRDNRFVHHVGYRAYGILLQTTEQVVAERNRIEGNLTGLFLDGAVGNTFRDNVISGNGIGIDVLASAEGNVFARNIVTHNRVAVRKVLGNGENAWDDGRAGNYWHDPSIFDLDGDGIGDRPYRVGDAYATLAATRPALELFSATLAARALSWAEEAFPVFETPRVEDRMPLVRQPDADARTDASAADPGRMARAAALLLLAVVFSAGSGGPLRKRLARRESR